MIKSEHVKPLEAGVEYFKILVISPNYFGTSQFEIREQLVFNAHRRLKKNRDAIYGFDGHTGDFIKIGTEHIIGELHDYVASALSIEVPVQINPMEE